MFLTLRMWINRIRTISVLKKINKIVAIPHTSGYSKSEGDRRVALLTNKHTKLNDDFIALYNRKFVTGKPVTMSRHIANRMCAWFCFAALCFIVSVTYINQG